MNQFLDDIPVLAVRNAILYPGMEIPFVVGRSLSVKAVQAVELGGGDIFVVAQKDSDVEVPGLEQLYDFGCLGTIKKTNFRDDGMEVQILGKTRCKLVSLNADAPFLRGKLDPVPLPQEESTEFEALHRSIINQLRDIQGMIAPASVAPLTRILQQIDDPLLQIFMLSSMLGLDLEREQKILACSTRLEAAEILHEYMLHEKQVLEVQRKIAQKIQSKLTKRQKEQLLREQLEQIKKELGESDPEQSEQKELEQKIRQADLPEKIAQEVEKQLKRLEQIHRASSDYQVIQSYLELVVELPWKCSTTDNLDLNHARRILDEDHYDLDEIKERIMEQLVVLKRNPHSKAPIICFVGPPGVGKTSLGESIARALGRRFERISLGGLHDEAELRGHRRTYIGAMPGRIIKSVNRAKSNNPVLMLDEIDKIGRDFRGDPAAALMEILDPAQNNSFYDNYLDLPFDLSRILFITTANTLDTIPRPLLDRMEVIELSGYSDVEKLKIAMQYIIPEKLDESGMDQTLVTFSDEAVLKIIRNFTREAGLRELGRSLARLIRKVAVKIDRAEIKNIQVDEAVVTDLLGVEKYDLARAQESLPIGVAVGLAWTPVGGDVLNIEATLLPGGKGLKLTGKLGEVMKESAMAAQSYLWSHARELELKLESFTDCGLHIHVPEGAIPKDGPSAGITMASALASLYMGKSIRADTAMTGELTLSGLVLPIGGLKEKALAAHRSGFKQVLIPKRNEKDLIELPDSVQKSLHFELVENLDQVLKHIFV